MGALKKRRDQLAADVFLALLKVFICFRGEQ